MTKDFLFKVIHNEFKGVKEPKATELAKTVVEIVSNSSLVSLSDAPAPQLDEAGYSPSAAAHQLFTLTRKKGSANLTLEELKLCAQWFRDHLVKKLQVVEEGTGFSVKTNVIKCKAEHDHKGGCSWCGGYKVVFTKQYCFKCNRYGWVRPGQYTVYEGKIFSTVDGLEFVYHYVKGKVVMICSHCEKGKK